MTRTATLTTALALVAAALARPASAGVSPAPAAPAAPADTSFSDWWNGKQLTGNWFGVRDTLKDNGVTLGGSYRVTLYGVVASENGAKAFWGQDLVFTGGVDFSKLLRADALKGLEGFVETRWRESNGGWANPNEAVEASSMFNPTPWWSGLGWRMLTFGMQYTTPELFGAKDFLTVRGGWLRPQKEFVDQPLSKLFENNAINSAKGLGGNIPFSSSFSTWGGTVAVKPLSWQYTKVGLFMSYPEGTFSENRGLMFQGYAPDPSQNMLYFMGETGFTPEIGSSKLPGKYAFGAYFYGEDNEVYGGAKYGFYWQADQMLFRERSAPQAEPDGKAVASDKKPELSKEGLSLFSLVTIAPAENSRYPFYAQGGLSYDGLVPGRSKDSTFIGFGIADYDWKPNQTYSAVIEGGYRMQINGWAFVKPYVQYISRPDGTSNVANAAVLGFQAGVNF